MEFTMEKAAKMIGTYKTDEERLAFAKLAAFAHGVDEFCKEAGIDDEDECNCLKLSALKSKGAQDPVAVINWAGEGLGISPAEGLSKAAAAEDLDDTEKLANVLSGLGPVLKGLGSAGRYLLGSPANTVNTPVTGGLSGGLAGVNAGTPNPVGYRGLGSRIMAGPAGGFTGGRFAAGRPADGFTGGGPVGGFTGGRPTGNSTNILPLLLGTSRGIAGGMPAAERAVNTAGAGPQAARPGLLEAGKQSLSTAYDYWRNMLSGR